MKRLVALIVVIFILVCSTGVLSSCEIIQGASQVEDTNQENNDNPENPENEDSSVGDPKNPDDNDNTNDSGNSDNQGGTDNPDPDCSADMHIDNNNDDYCDLCNDYLIVVIDLYAVNDLHGKFCDTDSQIGVDELGTFFNQRKEIDDHVVIMATGDMWQGAAESNLTKGVILTEWMNAVGFDSMTLGNHDFDWGSDAVKQNNEIADFPFLAINIYSVETGARVDYCEPSVMIERGGIQIGIIGAIGDCYSSISSNMVEDVYFKVGSDLTNLVKAESKRLRDLGADIIIYQLHDGYGDDNPMSKYYSSELSSGGYVDVVFESHSHQSYVKKDSYGVYHLQAGGENKGLSHVEFTINSANGSIVFTEKKIISTSEYSNLEDDPATEAIEEKYSELIDFLYANLGYVSKYQDDEVVEQYVADFYLEAGLEKWGDEYDIVLGGGFIRTRSPYNLSAGYVAYADLLALLPFDNCIVLCTISGANLTNQFINSTSSDYYISMSEYGSSISISSSSVYYVVVDTYTAFYRYNGLTIVDYYDETTFARDLFAQKVKEGMFDTSGGSGSNNDSVTSITIAEANNIGKTLAVGEQTSNLYYIQGKITSIENTKYGNLYLEDENGNSIYVYGLKDASNNYYQYMANPPKVGDTITVLANISNYYGTIELTNSKLQ